MLSERQRRERGAIRQLAAVAALIVLATGSPAHGQGLDPDVGLPGVRGGRLDRFGDPLPAGAVARLGTVRLQHGCGVTTVDFSPDGKLLASAGHDGVVRLWDVGTGREDRRLAAAYGAIAFLPDGKRVIAAGEEHLFVRDLATGGTLHEFPVPCRSFTLLGDGKTLVLPGDDDLQLLDPVAGTEVRTVKLAGRSVLAYSPDAKHAVVQAENSLRILDLATGGDTEFLTDPKNSAASVAYAPDGKSLAVCNDAGVITVWDAAARKPRFRLSDDAENAGCFLRYSPDGQRLLVAGLWSQPRIWEVSARKRVRACRPVPDLFTCAAFSPDGKTVAVAGFHGRLQFLDVDSGQLRMPFDQPPNAGSAALFCGDGQRVLTTTAPGDLVLADSILGESATVWDAASGKDAGQIKCYDRAGPIEATATGSALAVRSGIEDVTLITVATGARRQLPGPRGGGPHAISGDGTRVAVVTAGPESCDVGVWDVATGKQLRRFAKLARVTRLALSPDGATLITASLPNVVPWTRNVTFSDPCDGAIRAWDVATGRERWKFADARSQDFAFSPDGQWLATAGQRPAPDDSQLSTEVRLWDAATGREVWTTEKHAGAVHAFAFSPDGRTLATGCEEGEVRLREVASGLERLTFRAHQAGINSLSFAPDGRRLVTGGHDRTSLVWTLPDPPARPGDPARAWAALAADDGRQAYAAVRQLAADPERAVPLLRGRLRPAALPDANRVAKLIADLDSATFAVREAALDELAKAGDAALPAVRQALAAGGPAEKRRRLQQLVARADGYSPEQLREWRALEVLERIGTPDARQVLAAVAAGPPTARLTADAKAALQRLTARAAKP